MTNSNDQAHTPPMGTTQTTGQESTMPPRSHSGVSDTPRDMAPPERYTTKRERQLETALGTIRNAFPGRAPIWDLDRIAFMLDYEGSDEDAAALRKLASTLSNLRNLLRGKSKHDYERERNDRLKGTYTEHDERPFA